MSDFILVHGDGWEGLYVDGELQIQDHRISAETALKIALKNSRLESFKAVFADPDWLDHRGDLPRDFSDVIEAN